MTALLVVLSVILVGVGVGSLSQATLGVGVICVGVAFGVWARINQAAEHRKADERRRSVERKAQSAPVPAQGD